MSDKQTQGSRIAELEKQLEDAVSVIGKLQEKLNLLDYQADAIERARSLDPAECIARATKIVNEQEWFCNQENKRYTWESRRPDVYKSIYFHTDEGPRNAAIREWEDRVGTKLVTNRHKESENDTVTLVHDSKNPS